MEYLLKTADLFYRLIRQALNDPDSPTTVSLLNPTEEKEDESEAAKKALAKGGQELVQFVRKHGIDMSKQIPKKVYMYDFPGKTGSTMIIGNHIYHYEAKLIPVERQEHPEMRSDVDSVVKYIVQWAKKDSSTSELSPEGLKRFVESLLTQWKAEGSRLNYNFGFIQAIPKFHTDSNWAGHVMIIGDSKTLNGQTSGFIFPYISIQTFEQGINFWLSYLKGRGFIESAKADARSFVNTLQKGQYFDLPMKDVPDIDPETGEQKIGKDGKPKMKRVVDEKKAEEVRERYYKNYETVSTDPAIKKAIQKYVFGA
jgi:hypothetical protein